jgi:hypothetical protein
MATTISNTSLFSILDTIANGTFVGVHSLTEPKMRKTNNPFNGHRVQKLTIQTLQWGYNYANAVNNRIGDTKHETFVADSLKWGEWLVPNKVITHNGKLYARFYKVDNEMASSNVTYLIDGIIATEEQEQVIKSFLIAPSSSARQAEVGLTEHQVKPRDFSFDNIIGLSFKGEMYNIVKEEQAVATA